MKQLVPALISMTPCTLMTLAACAIASETTLVDGSFAGWSSDTRNDAGYSGTVIAIAPEAGDPPPAVTATTNSPALSTAYALCWKTDFDWNPAESGEIESLSLTIETAGLVSQGAGQAVQTLCVQSGETYVGLNDITTGPSTGWHYVSLAANTATSFGLLGGDALVDWDSHPDFSIDGTPIRFGFVASNTNSGVLSHLYDNYSLTIVHSDPAVSAPTPPRTRTWAAVKSLFR